MKSHWNFSGLEGHNQFFLMYFLLNIHIFIRALTLISAFIKGLLMDTFESQGISHNDKENIYLGVMRIFILSGTTLIEILLSDWAKRITKLLSHNMYR